MKENIVRTPDLLEIFKSDPESFNRVCDSLVDFQVPESLYSEISDAIINQGRLVSLITTHQSYFEIETQRKFCQNLKNVSSKPIDSYIFYSAPAVDLNIGEIFKARQPSYEKSHLHMLGIIRQEDRNHSKYKNNITPQMEKEHKENFKTFIQIIKKGGCLIISPLDAKLESGRINLQTGKINGLQATPDDDNLNRMVKRDALIIPCGIDGGYRVLNPSNHHLPTKEFIDAFNGQTKQKLVTFRANQIIDTKNKFFDQDIKQTCQQIIIEVAKLVSLDARGNYQRFVS